MVGEAPGSRRKRLLLICLSLAGFVLFAALGAWQVERRSWKLKLIASVEQRIHAPAVPPPPPPWRALKADDYAYLRVRVAGHLQGDRTTYVRALTDYGEGFWVLTPLTTPDGQVFLINRGFAPGEWVRQQGRTGQGAGGEVTISGLLRVTEPGGGFLRANDPQADRWFSRDVYAIAKARRLGEVAPFFIDADAEPGQSEWPRGGLTVVSFPNNHLLYALTWFSLAGLCAYALRLLLRHQ